MGTKSSKERPQSQKESSSRSNKESVPQINPESPSSKVKRADALQLEKVKRELPKISNEEKFTYLFEQLRYSFKHGSPETAKYLISKGAQIKEIDKAGYTMLHCACCSLNVELITLALSEGVPKSVEAKNGYTAMMCVCTADGNTNQKIPALRALLEAKCPVSPDCMKYFFDAANKGDEQYVLLALQYGEYKVFPLQLCATIGNVDVIETMLTRGEVTAEDLGKPDQNGNTALQCAFRAGHWTIVQRFIAHGAIVVDVAMTKPWMCAVTSGNMELFQTSMNTEVDRNELLTLRTNDGYTAFGLACSKGNLDIVQAILAISADCVNEEYVDSKTGYHMAPITLASRSGNVKVMELLVSYGIVPKELNPLILSPIIVAAENNQIKSIEYLLTQGVNIDTQHLNGSTALIIASRLGYVKIVELLIANKASVDIHDELGRTALTEATRKQHADIQRKLKKAGADTTYATENGVLEFLLIREIQPEVCRKLLDRVMRILTKGLKRMELNEEQAQYIELAVAAETNDVILFKNKEEWESMEGLVLLDRLAEYVANEIAMAYENDMLETGIIKLAVNKFKYQVEKDLKLLNAAAEVEKAKEENRKAKQEKLVRKEHWKQKLQDDVAADVTGAIVGKVLGSVIPFGLGAVIAFGVKQSMKYAAKKRREQQLLTEN